MDERGAGDGDADSQRDRDPDLHGGPELYCDTGPNGGADAVRDAERTAGGDIDADVSAELDGDADGVGTEAPTAGATPTPTATSTATATPTFLAPSGDANCDGRVSAADVVAAIRLIPFNDPGPCGQADADGNGTVDAIDVREIAGEVFGTQLTFVRACGGTGRIGCPSGEHCELPPGTCMFPNQVGQCDTIPDQCPAIVAPVCGCDGITYVNDCARRAAGVNIDHDGPCGT